MFIVYSFQLFPVFENFCNKICEEKRVKQKYGQDCPSLDQEGGTSVLFHCYLPVSHPHPVIRVELVNTSTVCPFLSPAVHPLGKWPGIGLCAVSSHEISLLQSGLIILSHKKEQNWVICRELDGPRLCHTEEKVRKRKTNIVY